MTELKTLKDLEVEYNREIRPWDLISKTRVVIRKEAIKYAKEDFEKLKQFEEHKKETEELNKRGYYQGTPMKPIACEIRLDFIIKFFNITKEELK